MGMALLRLKSQFDYSELEWKPQSLGFSKDGKPWALILCYVSARAIQNRLDEVFGPLAWADEYRHEQNGVICRLSVYDGSRWITKENGSPETDVEAFKGGISSAFKRVAASGYGIGRYLYNLDTTFAECSLTFKKGYKKATTKDKRSLYWLAPNSLPCKVKIESCNTITELKNMWSTFNPEEQKQYEDLKDLRKIQIERVKR